MVKLNCAIVFSVLFCGTLSQTTTYDDGLEAFNGDFPWVAYIEPHDTDQFNAYDDCLGSLISPTWVFTTARCNVVTSNGVHSQINGQYRVYLGSVNISESEISMISTNFVTHPEFDLFGHHNLNNAGLIELPSEVTYNDVVSAITLPWSIANIELSGFQAHFVGRRFGFQSSGVIMSFSFVFKNTNILIICFFFTETGDSHAIIRWNMLNIISNEACQVMSGNFKTETEICAFGITSNPSKTPCRSNGFLALQTDLGFVLISGSGNDECSVNLPNYFPRASLSLDFIRTVTGLGDDQ